MHDIALHPRLQEAREAERLHQEAEAGNCLGPAVCQAPACPCQYGLDGTFKLHLSFTSCLTLERTWKDIARAISVNGFVVTPATPFTFAQLKRVHPCTSHTGCATPFARVTRFACLTGRGTGS